MHATTGSSPVKGRAAADTRPLPATRPPRARLRLLEALATGTPATRRRSSSSASGRSGSAPQAAHLASRALADKYATVVVEDLDVSAMTAIARKAPTRSRGGTCGPRPALNREILAGNWYQLQPVHGIQDRGGYGARAAHLTGPARRAGSSTRRTARNGTCSGASHVDCQATLISWQHRTSGAAHAVPTAAAQAVAAREICLPDREQPANSQPNSITAPSATSGERQGGESPPGERSRLGQGPEIVTQPSGDLIPQAWGPPGARKRPDRRRSRQPRKPSRRNDV